MDPSEKLKAEQSEYFADPERYRRLLEKLSYLTVTKPDLSFAAGVISQFYVDSLITKMSSFASSNT